MGRSDAYTFVDKQNGQALVNEGLTCHGQSVRLTEEKKASDMQVGELEGGREPFLYVALKYSFIFNVDSIHLSCTSAQVWIHLYRPCCAKISQKLGFPPCPPALP